MACAGTSTGSALSAAVAAAAASILAAGTAGGGAWRDHGGAIRAAQPGTASSPAPAPAPASRSLARRSGRMPCGRNHRIATISSPITTSLIASPLDALFPICGM